MESVSSTSDEAYQDEILPHVSRTFALTIPQLPPALRTPVTSAYLLCRIADTIEDEPALSASDTYVFLERFTAVVKGKEDAARLARDVVPRLSERTLAAERDLVANMERVVRVVSGFDERQRAAICRCIEVMSRGMHQFQRTASVRGLARSSDMDAYCYYVAGIVGETLTELFCAYSPAIMRHYEALYALAPSFGQGLQMTNILKDVWEDRSRGACWLPQEVFSRYGVDLADLSPERSDERFHAAVLELIGVAHRHLRNALAFTLLIPAEEAGIRLFCLWALGLAALTLRKIQTTPGFTAGAQVKVSRSAVMMTRTLTTVSVRNDRVLQQLFNRAARGLPLAEGPVPVKPAAAPAPALDELGASTRLGGSLP
ncbi:MAG TPA: phytoene/squalene synthase family protein [Steroidobacteraceae bacterium]|nr:phytoene/squalene synthase family protein [Steroidobacteraceae bacterium]